MSSLFAKTPDQIASILGLRKAFHGRQIYNHLVKCEFDFMQMTDLPLSLRETLSAVQVFSSTIIDRQEDSDGAMKLALRLEDNNVIETVLLTDREGNLTACLSSQVGCAMGCRFCRTGTLHLTRSLNDYEIVEQFMHLQNCVKQSAKTSGASTISHVVFMGMGEPLTNMDNVLSAIEFLHDPKGLNLSHRRITISTCGLVPGIEELSRRKVPVKLAVSLVTADDEKRSALMPVNRSFGLASLKKALNNFQSENNRRFTFEYCMIKDMNISSEDAQKLASFCKGLEVIVNLIPFNPCPELDFETPSKAEIEHFTRELENRGVEYTIRVSRGRSIKGACGQLAAKYK